MENKYLLNEKIYESSLTVIHKGIRLTDNSKVILKILNKELPVQNEIIRFSKEFEILKDCAGKNVVKVYNLEQYLNTILIELEDFDGKPISHFIKSGSLDLHQILYLISETVSGLESIHSAGYMHKDINTNNILFNSETLEVKIIDLNIAEKYDLTSESNLNPIGLEGTIAYISPEQTGRVNLNVDFRTDFFSLGTAFYEMLTGILPFSSSDQLELIHSLLAEMPNPPHIVNKNIPEIVSKIVLKLLAKNPNDRYQSCFGLKHDLNKCIDYGSEFGFDKLDKLNFEIAEKDFSVKFEISKKIVGRQKEIEAILKSYNRSKEGKSEIVILYGNQGTGKTTLINELQNQISDKKLNIYSGKFDEFHSNIPFYALIQIINQFVNQKLSCDAKTVSHWSKRILKNVGSLGKIITEIAPNLEFLIGKQTDIPILEGLESQNRFLFTMTNFFKSIADEKNPVIVFIDDIQYSDKSSLDLIKHLVVSHQLENVLFIVTYRTNEVDKNAMLKIVIDEITKSDTIYQQIELGNIDNKNVFTIVSNTLNSSTNKEKDLSVLIYNKTQGNPYFVNQFLNNIYNEKLIYYDITKQQWNYEIPKIEKLKITENVLEYLSEKINKLPDDAKELLKVAACIGLTFDFELLSKLSNVEISQTEKIISIWEKENLIELIEINVTTKKYSFIHDKIWKVAYSKLDISEKTEIHYKIAKLLISNFTDAEILLNIYEIVYHWNNCYSILNNEDEKNKVSELNYKAGLKAKSSSAKQLTYEYFKNAVEFLNPSAWKNNYNFTLELHNNAIVSSYINGEYEYTFKCIDQVEKNATNIEDVLYAYEIKIQVYKALGQLPDALKNGIEIVKKFNIKLNPNPSKLSVILNYIPLKIKLAGKTIEELINLPEITDKKILSILRIMSNTGVAAYFHNPKALPINIFKRIHIGLKKGNADIIAISYSGYGLLLCGVFEDFENGYKFGKLSFTLLEKLNSNSYKVEIQFRYNAFIRHWKEHVKNSVKPFLDSYFLGLETGEVEFASHSLANHFMFKYLLGYQLNKLKQEMADYHNPIKQLQQTSSYHWFLVTYQATESLINNTGIENFFKGEFFNEDKILPELIKNEDKTTLSFYYYIRTYINFTTGNYTEAINLIEINKKYSSGMTSTYYLVRKIFIETLTYLAAVENVDGNQKNNYLKIAEQNLKKLKKFSKACPENNLHKVYLVTAEKYRVLKSNTKAREYYDLAIIAAKENGFINQLAMANELAGKFHLSQNQIHTASHYFDDAFHFYTKWGATFKVEDLRKNYPQFFANKSVSKTTMTTFGTTVAGETRTVSVQSVDLISVVKASQAIAGEISLAKLLEKMLNIVLENAGAENGVIIENNSGKLFVQAVGKFHGNVSVMLNQPVEESTNCCHSIINYVSRTKEIFIIDDASADINYSSDNYVKTNKIKSVLCFPLINKNHLSAIIYLENNIMQGAFNANRVEILKMLSSQITTSIENAVLYENLEEKVKERTLEVEKQKEELINQAHKLEEYNQELEKLSIVASETDNAVLIMDANGNFEWVNEGYTRLYGYNLVTLINDVGFNLMSISSHPNIKEIFSNCVNLKKSITYESTSKTSKGMEIWVQTTLTPILDEFGNVVRLVAIDSNISKLKEFENQILDKNHLLNIQNENIKSSIRYALTIQSAILPDKNLIDSFYENFIIYRPKDIVSGDFYWFSEIKNGENSTIFAAVADCTGHGVPGAFMSLIGNRLLNEIIIEKEIHSPAEVMELLNIEIRTSLHQDTTDNIDGMDISLCKIEKISENQQKVTFSGAKSTIFYYIKNESKISIMRGDRIAIGGMKATRNNLNFTNQEIIFNKSDVLYLFSDGIIDQNNNKRLRFGSERFISVLEQAANENMETQKMLIEKALDEWQQKEDQRDDITVLGFKF